MSNDEAAGGGILERVDRLYEFEREPVTEDRFESAHHFAAVFAGEHVAGTEFVIGAVFVSWGVGAGDVVLGLLLGNLLAVLSWTFICAPIAVGTRLTLYWYLRRIAGPTVTAIYNVLNAVLFCMLSGTMITVSASAVRILLGIPPQTNWYPDDLRFVLVAMGVGAVVVTVAILGFRRLAQFSTICVPWIFVMFFAGALFTLPLLAVDTPGVASLTSPSDLWTLGKAKIWIADPDSQFGMWHVVAFAWICNLAFHVGLSDMAVLRFAPRASYGLFSACGMYLGHFLAWVCAGVMGAAAAQLLQTPLAELDAGEVAYRALGVSGIICVILAGWATSNPTLYRAGLALQSITPNWPRWLVTLAAGIFTTGVACFPFVFGYLLEFVALFGILLAPVGAIVFVEHWVFPRLGLQQFRTETLGKKVNWLALLVWVIAVGCALGLTSSGLAHLFFVAIPIWCLTAVLYTLSSAVASKGRGPAESAAESQGGRPQSAGPSRSSPERDRGQSAFTGSSAVVAGVAVASLLVCVALPVWVFLSGQQGYEGRIGACQTGLAVASVVHLASAAFWVLRTERDSRVA